METSRGFPRHGVEYFTIMITNESQVRLSVELQGRLASTGANSSSKKQLRKYAKALKYGASPKPLHYEAPTYQKATQSVLISTEAVQYFISEEGRPAGKCSPSDWKKKNKMERLQFNLQISADDIAGKNGAKFTFEVIN